MRSLTISGFGLLGGFLPVLSYAVLALVAGIGSTIVAEARDFRAADIQVESFSTVQALHYMDQLITERTAGRHRIMVFHSGERLSPKIGGWSSCRLLPYTTLPPALIERRCHTMTDSVSRPSDDGVATSREDHRSPRSGPAVPRRRRGQERY